MVAPLVLLALPLAARAADVLPLRPCDSLPEAGPGVQAWVASVAPELAETPVRELSQEMALSIFGKAAAAGWGGIDLFTSGLFREPCVFHMPSRALRALDARYEIDLLTVISGKDKDNQFFQMRGVLGGLGKVLVFYDRDGIVYRNPKHDRDFMLSSRVEFESPARGRIENVDGLCAEVQALGCVGIHSMTKQGNGVTVRAGMFTSRSPLDPIRLKVTRVPRS